MENKTGERSTEALLKQIAENQQRDMRSSRITAIAVLVLAAALIISLVVMVPAFMRTMNEAKATMESTQALIREANVSLEKLNRMTESIDTVVTDSSQSMGRVLQVLDAMDLEGLAASIQKFNSVIDSLSNFRLFG
ncbi:MAG: hypothetical protein IJQ36_10030 [Oscillospiraceae bacterium]|nr:hypothetical protein [Oscillospiraceae bacterium]